MKNKKIMAAILAATLTFGTVAFSGCKGDDKTTAQNPTSESVQVANDNLTLTEQGGNGIQMLSVLIAPDEYLDYNVSANAESAYLVTASYPEGEYVSNLAVDWWVEFVKSDSEWATGKKASDYVTVTPTSDGALTAVVACKQAFSEQIRVVCASRQSPDKSDSFVCDYMSIVEKVDLNFKADPGYFVFSDVSLGTGYTKIIDEYENLIDLNAKDIVGQYNDTGFVTITRTTGTTSSFFCNSQLSTVVLEYEEEYRSLISQSDILSFQANKSGMWYGYLGLPGIDRLENNQIISILYYWELNHGGDVSNEKLAAEYDDGGAAYYEYLRIMNELAALSNDTVTYTIRFDTQQTYKGEGVFLDLVFKVTDASEYFKAEASSLTLDTDHILFEP